MNTTKTDWEMIEKIESTIEQDALNYETDEEKELEENIDELKNEIGNHLYIYGGDQFNCGDFDAPSAFFHKKFQMEHGLTQFHSWDSLWSNLLKINTLPELAKFINDFNNMEKTGTYTVDDFIEDYGDDYSEDELNELKEAEAN